MVNLYALTKGSNMFPKMEVSELLFVEYSCMQEATKFGIWSDSNYFAFVCSGKKIWRTIYNSYEPDAGDIIFVKKGANLTHQFFDEQFCAIFMFIPDDFIREFLGRNPHLLNVSQKDLYGQDAVLTVEKDELLQSYYHSIQSYFSLKEKPNEQLLKLKFDELLLSIFYNDKHRQLTDYFISLCQSREYQLSRVMEENFAYNLQLEDYARLCHMSLSAFKKAFRQQYNTTPGNWLRERKLQLATQKLIATSLHVSQVSFDCGFEDTSHFIRVFKQKYQLTPFRYRQQYSQVPVTEV